MKPRYGLFVLFKPAWSRQPFCLSFRNHLFTFICLTCKYGKTDLNVAILFWKIHCFFNEVIWHTKKEIGTGISDCLQQIE